MSNIGITKRMWDTALASTRWDWLAKAGDSHDCISDPSEFHYIKWDDLPERVKELLSAGL